MREIKFQAWDIDFKKMWIVMSLTREEQTPFMLVRESIESESCARPSKLLKIRQYTGLKDNNGKEIYEGDVLGVKLQKRNKKFNFTHVVEWEDGIELYGGNHWSGYGYSLPNFHVEVIGNIYENPELLEKK